MTLPIERAGGRGAHELRPVSIERGAALFAEGSCLIAMGRTRVLCTASVEAGVPGWRRGSGAGWVTAEYAMLPRATHQRTSRERGQVGGRTQEIQRLIGRSLRACVDMEMLGDWTIRIDCDVLQADGGTRTASITGGAVALREACEWLVRTQGLDRSPMLTSVAALSVGVVQGTVLVDLDYSEDSTADADFNVVSLPDSRLIEVQGTAEHAPFSAEQLAEMTARAGVGIQQLFAAQEQAFRNG
jgi:ribonuclease PH